MAAPQGAPTLAPPFVPFTLEWDGPQMSEADLAAYPNAFEWWYFDLATDDGVELVVIFSRQNPVFATRRASIYAEYHDPKRAFKHIRNYPREGFRWQESPADRLLTLDRSRLRIVGADPRSMHYEVTVDLPWIQATLTMTPEHRGFLPVAGGEYFHHRSDRRLFTAVSFSAPLMRSTGTVTIDGVTRTVSGRGYHDHPWGTQQIFFTNLKWNWARAATPALGVMFADVTPAAEFEGKLTFVYTGATGSFEPQVTGALTLACSDWRKDSLLGIRFPHALDVATPTGRWKALATASMLDTPIYNRCAVTWTPEPHGAAGKGWVEYFLLPPWARRLASLGARLQSFFMRPFPWFGR